MHPEFLQKMRAGPSLWGSAISSCPVVDIPVRFIQQLVVLSQLFDGHRVEMIPCECTEEEVAFECAPLARLVYETSACGVYGFTRPCDGHRWRDVRCCSGRCQVLWTVWQRPWIFPATGSEGDGSCNEVNCGHQLDGSQGMFRKCARAILRI